jgi:hypothetical protein
MVNSNNQREAYYVYPAWAVPCEKLSVERGLVLYKGEPLLCPKCG